MKILQIIQKKQLRGGEVFACSLANQLARKGHTSIIVTVFDGDSSLPFDGTILSLKGSKANRSCDWRAWKKLSEIVSTERPDLIQANPGDALKYAVLSKLIFGWKVPIVFRNASTISLYITTPMSRWFNSFLLRFVTYIISVSIFSRNDFVRVFPFTTNKITVITNGVSIPTTKDKTQELFGFPFFVHIGGFTYEKNHKGLINIFERLRAKYPGATLGLIGDGPLRSEIEALVVKKGLQDSVIFFGYQSEPVKYLTAAECFLLPSIIEGMPAVVLESFLHHVPVVAYDVGGVSEMVVPGATGWLVKMNEESTFAEAVSEAIENRDKRMEYTENAFGSVKEKFCMEEIADRFRETYLKILQPSKLVK